QLKGHCLDRLFELEAGTSLLCWLVISSSLLLRKLPVTRFSFSIQRIPTRSSCFPAASARFGYDGYTVGVEYVRVW
ncbi:hypothetical protein LINGRAHAP2_LOCUS22510, partial [Linum grandiflorum]